MSLVPFEPFRHLDNMKRDLERFLSDGFPNFRSGIENLGMLRVDVHETETEVVATCDIPGLEKKEDVSIHIDQNVLSISGSINRMNEVDEENMHRRERYVGRFHRTIPLPAKVSEEGVRATYKNGVLEVRMPKVQQEPQRRIDVDFQ